MEPIGRDAELALVTERLRDRRLVTLVGPGGIGKTTLARAAAARVAGEYGEGCVVVDLTRVVDAEGVRESFAAQLGAPSFVSLLDAPGDRSTLLLVDNCEHVLDGAAEAVAELLAACQMPTVLATSRAALELPYETVVPIGPLGLPPAGSLEAPAVDLFLRRAVDAGAGVEASDALAELCRRLDGVPLAIELAAARCRSLSPEEILARLEAGLDVLDRPRRRSARRHQSLRATIAWSYDLLAPDEQALFERVCAFQGPFTAELAATIAPTGADVATTVDLLDGLVAASMLVAEPSAGVTWFRVLDALQTFGRERLGDAGLADAVAERVVDALVHRVGSVVADGARGWSAGALGDLMALYDNVTAAVRWCLHHDDSAERALLLVAALWGVVHQAHTEDVGGLAEAVLERWPDGGEALRPDAMATAATCRFMLGDHVGAVALATAGLELADRSPFAGATLRRAIAQSTRATGDAEGGLRWFDEAGAVARGLGLPALAVEADTARAQILADLARPTEAAALIRRAHDEAVAEGSDVMAAWALAVEGSTLLRTDPARATEVLEAALVACRRIEYPSGEAVALRALALAAVLRGDLRTAAATAQELIELLIGSGSTYELRLVLDVASAVLARAGRARAAADLAATALSRPIVSITASVGHEVVPVDATGGQQLGTRDAILVTRNELGLLMTGEGGPDRGAAIAARTDARVGVFRRAGELWEVGLAGDLVTVKGAKGMDDLATLLRSPGREVHCLDLTGGGVLERDTGEALDATARRQYEARVRELQADIDAAAADNDHARADRAQLELDAIVDQLTAALGLGGRSRSQGSSVERARSTVTQRIRATVRRLGEVHPRLGRHLEASVRTGTFCRYDPEAPVRWQL